MRETSIYAAMLAVAATLVEASPVFARAPLPSPVAAMEPSPDMQAD